MKIKNLSKNVLPLFFIQWVNQTKEKEGKYRRQVTEQIKTLFCRTPYYFKGKHISEVPLEAFTCTTRSHVEHTVEDYKPLISFSVLMVMFVVCMFKCLKVRRKGQIIV